MSIQCSVWLSSTPPLGSWAALHSHSKQRKRSSPIGVDGPKNGTDLNDMLSPNLEIWFRVSLVAQW